MNDLLDPLDVFVARYLVGHVGALTDEMREAFATMLSEYDAIDVVVRGKRMIARKSVPYSFTS